MNQEENERVMNEIEVMKPLYPPEGASVRGYFCTQCKEGRSCLAVTKTKKGMWAHLRVVHGVKKQPSLMFPGHDDRVTHMHSEEGAHGDSEAKEAQG